MVIEAVDKQMKVDKKYDEEKLKIKHKSPIKISDPSMISKGIWNNASRQLLEKTNSVDKVYV